MSGRWYATHPEVLADSSVREALVERLRAPRDGAGRRLVAALEAHVAANPARAFTFDAAGSASLVGFERSFAAGRFETPTLGDLRARATARRQSSGGARGGVRLTVMQGAHVLTDIGTLQATAPEGSLFQVASQFDCLEAPSARVVPVADYLGDPTQGPRASISALPGTLLRHYAAPKPGGGRFVQTDAFCINLLEDVLDAQVAEVRCGYLMGSAVRDEQGLAARLRERFDLLRLGVHDDVEVVFGHDWVGPVPTPPPHIAHVLTSTLAQGGYGRDTGSPHIAAARQALLAGAYLGTLLAALALGRRVVVLTLIGGGVFGNPHTDIWRAIFDGLTAIEPLLTGDLEVVVNAREAVADSVASEVRSRGGTLTRFADSGVSIDR